MNCKVRDLFFVFAVVFAVSCGVDNNTSGGLRKGQGNVYYGGIFRMNEIEDFRSLFPLNVTEVAADHITRQVYEGLVKLSQSNLTVIPCIAESWDKNENATVWTFYLRKGVIFHDDSCFPRGKGREVTAHDFKYCFDMLCTESPVNQQFGNSFANRVVGAKEYYISTKLKKPLKEGVSGVKVIDDFTLQITLIHPFAGFLNILTTPGCFVYPKEAYEKYNFDMRTKCVGTGPFKVKTVNEKEVVFLERNNNYWDVDKDGNKLPYLDGIKFTFIKEKKAELLEFKRGNLDMVYRIPNDMISSILGELEDAREANPAFNMQVVPAMTIFYYGFQHQSDIFSKKEVRLAFNYAIDREKIVNYILLGDGVPGIYGIVPPVVSNYNSKLVKGFTLDVDKARNYLTKAGYPGGKGFPKLKLQTNSGGGDRNIQIAEAIQKMLKENLNVSVDIDVVPLAEHLESLETGKTLFWRSGWVADYPDPESFLTLLYGKHVPNSISEKSYLNSVRYRSQKFDSLFAAAMKETDDLKRMMLYHDADQTAIDDAAIMPVFYEENYRLIQTSVKKFPANAMEYRDMSRVYFEPLIKDDE
jgi:oligopeptide transport system substrate-binding protein